MADNPEETKAIVDAAMRLSAELGWDGFSLSDVATQAGLPLSAMYDRFPSKTAILSAFVRMVDQAVLEQAGPFSAADTPRDRLFDVLMLRFDQLTPYRAGLSRVVDSVMRDPMTALVGLPEQIRSMQWMLEAANISAEGVMGLIRAKGLGLIWLAALRIWREDDTADLSRTMAALDRYLRRAEWLARVVDRPRRGRGSAPTYEPIDGELGVPPEPGYDRPAS